MTCEKCDTEITSQNYDGQVNIHKTKQGWLCTHRFYFVDGAAKPNMRAAEERQDLEKCDGCEALVDISGEEAQRRWDMRRRHTPVICAECQTKKSVLK